MLGNSFRKVARGQNVAAILGPKLVEGKNV